MGKKQKVASPWIGRPVIAPDGETMPFKGDRYTKKERNLDGPNYQNLEPPTVSNDLYVYYASFHPSANGTYYFDTYKENDSTFPIRYSRLIDGKHEAPIALPKAINTGTFLSHPFIAPDESYLLFDAEREDGFGESDIYIFHSVLILQKDGTWGNGINDYREIK